MVLENTCFLCNRELARGEYYYVMDFFESRYKFMDNIPELQVQEIWVCYECHMQATITDKKQTDK